MRASPESRGPGLGRAAAPHAKGRLKPRPGTIVPCACNRPGCTFVAQKLKPYQRQRRFAPDCAWYDADLKRRNAESAKRAHIKRVGIRRCRCGCGRELPKFCQRHPECESRSQHRAAKRRARKMIEGKILCKRGKDACFDLPWQRHPLGCIECGLPYAPESELRIEQFMGRMDAGE